MEETAKKYKSSFTFGTPAKETGSEEQFISPITGKSVRFEKSPEETEESPGPKNLYRSGSASKTLYSSYPCKSPNERLIDIKNSTWRTKHEMAMHGRLDPSKKLLYTIGPREAYVVDKAFDRDMNFLKLGELSKDGEIVFNKTGEKEYVIDPNTQYQEEYSPSKSKVTHDMRRKLFKDMDTEHQVVLESPKKYKRTQK